MLQLYKKKCCSFYHLTLLSFLLISVVSLSLFLFHGFFARESFCNLVLEVVICITHQTSLLFILAYSIIVKVQPLASCSIIQSLNCSHFLNQQLASCGIFSEEKQKLSAYLMATAKREKSIPNSQINDFINSLNLGYVE